MVLHDWRFSVNRPLNSADDWYTGILENVIQTDEYAEPFFLLLHFYLSNLTSCGFGDSDVILITWFLKIKHILCIASGSVPSVSKRNS